ncbi:site-specific integrase [Chelativorans sp. AA-79]|uniref:tyrosine-type recombinase/integrase n=1 Tax=Chelativorans sp. AA-79 TaxID=3028735 RepID=UPI0023F64C62|nr:site-specific integrase [Chelativorans sp. AA-79]WEX08931.1 tyrosine-type recombinase/integrase [Chelativorans sp. AA-79]
MRKKLTTKLIDALPPAEGKRYEVRDTLVPGLHIRVSATGAKVWYLAIRVEGRLRRIKLGTYPVISLSDAREQAQSTLRDIALGKYAESAPGSSEAPTPTLGDVIPQFIDLYAKPRNRDWQGTKRILTKFSTLDTKPIDQIKRADVVRVLDGMVANGTPTRANRALAAIKKVMSWCVDRGMIEVSPIAGLKAPAKEVARERVLTDGELAACWNAAVAEGFPFAAFVQILILTGQRRGEVAGMRWSELDLAKGTWTIPAKRAKNANAHIVPLAPLAVDILKSVPRFLGSDLVFTTTGKTAVSGFGRLKRRLEDAVGLDAEDWWLHDIRRTVATNMAIMRIQPHIIEAVLNHKTGIVSGVAAVYNRHAYLEEKREALERWADHVERLVARDIKILHHASRGAEAVALT